MLILSRRTHEKILFPSINASIEVVAIRPGVVRLGVEAPPEVAILREEIASQAGVFKQLERTSFSQSPDSELIKIVRNRIIGASASLSLLRRQVTGTGNEAAVAILDQLDHEFSEFRQKVESTLEKANDLAPKKRANMPKALLVEDDHNERELLAGFLRMGGMSVDTVGDGVDALNYLNAGGRPDVVLLDMGLPRCDGPTTACHIRRDPAYAGLKIFAVTGSLPEDFGGDASRMSIDRWFHKPLDPQALLQDLQQDLAAVA